MHYVYVLFLTYFFKIYFIINTYSTRKSPKKGDPFFALPSPSDSQLADIMSCCLWTLFPTDVDIADLMCLVNGKKKNDFTSAVGMFESTPMLVLSRNDRIKNKWFWTFIRLFIYFNWSLRHRRARKTGLVFIQTSSTYSARILCRRRC